MTLQDSSAITVIDSKTTRVGATLNCNYMPSDDLAQVLYELVTNYLPNAIINIERNGVAVTATSAYWVTSVFPELKRGKGSRILFATT